MQLERLILKPTNEVKFPKRSLLIISKKARRCLRRNGAHAPSSCGAWLWGGSLCERNRSIRYNYFWRSLCWKMPIDISLYPRNWKTIALEVKETANWKCAALRVQSSWRRSAAFAAALRKEMLQTRRATKRIDWFWMDGRYTTGASSQPWPKR